MIFKYISVTYFRKIIYWYKFSRKNMFSWGSGILILVHVKQMVSKFNMQGGGGIQQMTKILMRSRTYSANRHKGHRAGGSHFWPTIQNC